MPIPATTGRLCRKINEMEIGDYIVVAVNNDIGGYLFGIDTTGYTERPVEGMQGSHSGYFWYGIKVDSGLIISDRVTTHTTSWDAQNTAKNIQGSTLSKEIEGITNMRIRSLTGGVAYADENGNLSLEDKGLGAFPTNNEWDKFIKGFPLSLIRDGASLEDIFHFESINTWCQETPISGTLTNASGDKAAITPTWRVRRGWDGRVGSAWKNFTCDQSTLSASNTGLRPVFEYKEV